MTKSNDSPLSAPNLVRTCLAPFLL